MEKRMPLLRVQRDKHINQKKKKEFAKKVVDYLISDSYMYSHLLIPSRPSDATTPDMIKSPPSGPSSDKSKRSVTSVLSSRAKTVTQKTEQATRQPISSLLEDHLRVDQRQPVGRPEIVNKHMLRYNACISSGPVRGVDYSKCSATTSTTMPLLNNLVASATK